MTSFEYIETGGAPIKAWTRGVPIEDTARRQIENVARLPFIHKHVAIMPDVHWGMGATVGSVIPTVGAIIPAAVGVDIGCFRGDTRIPLLDGTQKPIADLVGHEFWVYSCTKDGCAVPGKATALLTRRSAALVKVIVSGGDEIICTPDQRFMTLDGSYCEARHLCFNQSLMPLYRRWQARDGYESCAAGNGQWRQTHELVYAHCHGPLPPGHVIHHKNINHFDNRPDNFEAMTSAAHSALHRTLRPGFTNADPAFRERRRAGMQRRRSDSDKAAQMVRVGEANIRRYMEERPEHFAEAVAENGRRGAPYLRLFNQSPSQCRDCGYVAQNPLALRWHRHQEHAVNHKVLAVENIFETADVYCLQVERYHNFAVAAGVFVHNCGMAAVRTSIAASQLPDSLAALRSDIEAAVPHGRTDHGRRNDTGAWTGNPPALVVVGWERLKDEYAQILEQHPKAAHPRALGHLGTLGTGNHFIELCLDEDDRLWVMLHSGSRGPGNKLGTYFIELAKKEMRRWFINLPDEDLAYLPDGTAHFGAYLRAVGWAQRYARLNRELMMEAVLAVLRRSFPQLGTDETAVNCHHNYVAKERHFGREVWLTRKGAVRAGAGELGIIPGSMGAKSFIVRGKGNAESFETCAHGAGRAMSRNEAKRRFTLEDHARATAHVECRKDEGVLDETPGAYKDVEAVMAAQTDLVEIVHTLRQILCVKG